MLLCGFESRVKGQKFRVEGLGFRVEPPPPPPQTPFDQNPLSTHFQVVEGLGC